jgi:hypothetical protein
MRRGDFISAIVCFAMAVAIAYERQKSWERLTPGKRKFRLFAMTFLIVWGVVELVVAFT